MSNAGKTVVVAALDATFQRKWFENIVDLVPLAEHVVKLTAVCMCCFGEASYTKDMVYLSTDYGKLQGLDKVLKEVLRGSKDIFL